MLDDLPDNGLEEAVVGLVIDAVFQRNVDRVVLTSLYSYLIHVTCMGCVCVCVCVSISE